MRIFKSVCSLIFYAQTTNFVTETIETHTHNSSEKKYAVEEYMTSVIPKRNRRKQVL